MIVSRKMSPAVKASRDPSRDTEVMDPCQTQRADVDDLHSHLPSKKGIKLNKLEHQARFLDTWGLLIGVVPVYVI